MRIKHISDCESKSILICNLITRKKKPCCKVSWINRKGVQTTTYFSTRHKKHWQYGVYTIRFQPRTWNDFKSHFYNLNSLIAKKDKKLVIKTSLNNAFVYLFGFVIGLVFIRIFAELIKWIWIVVYCIFCRYA